MRDYNDMLEYELQKMEAGQEEQLKFFNTAVAIQNSETTYDINYADRKYAFACDVLCHCGFCNRYRCERCKLHEANARAHDDILNGRRKKAERTYSSQKRKTEEFVFRLSVDKNTGRITRIMKVVG